MDSYFDLQTLCKLHNIELRGDDGQPYCCGERMNVKGGLIGPDYAECLKCKKTIGDITSPHINGGLILPDKVYKDHLDGAWVCLEKGEDIDGKE